MNGIIETREDFDRLIAKAEKLAADLNSGRVRELRLGKGPSNRVGGVCEIYHFNQQANWIDGKSEIKLWHGNESNWRTQMQDAILGVILNGREPQVVLPMCWTGVPAKHTAEQLEYDRATSNSNLWTPDPNDWHFKYRAKDIKMMSDIPKAQEVAFDQKPQPGSKFPMVVEVESKSEAGKVYRVTIENEQGFATCTCKGFSYRHDCRHCKLARQKVFGKETLVADVPKQNAKDVAALDSTLEDLLEE